MTSHFGTIGLEVRNKQAYGELLRRLYGLGTAEALDGGGQRVVWTGAGGARVELELDAGGSLVHVLPCLLPRGAPVPVRGIALGPDGTAHMELLDGRGGEADGSAGSPGSGGSQGAGDFQGSYGGHSSYGGGELLCPLPVELTDRAELRALGRTPGGAPQEGALRLSALAERIELFEDAKAYDASQSERAMKFAPDFLIPSGLFRPDDSDEGWTPTAHALFAGQVVAAERTESEISGEIFHRVRVRTIGGIEVDVAAATAQLPHGPTPGEWVKGTFFMTGSLGLPPLRPTGAA